MGAMMSADRQGCTTPPEVRPTRKRVEAAVKTTRPSQSTAASFLTKEEASCLRRRQR